MNTKYGNLINHHHRVVKKHRIHKLLQEAPDGTCTKQNVIAGWIKTGLFPFKHSKILKTQRIPPDIQLDFEWPEYETIDSGQESSLRESPGPAQQIHDVLKYQAVTDFC